MSTTVRSSIRFGSLLICLLIVGLVSGIFLPIVEAAPPSLTGPIFAQAPLPQAQPGQAEEWFYRERAYPNTTIPPGARQKALEQARQVPEAAGIKRPDFQAKVPTVGAAWTAIGPNAGIDPEIAGTHKVSGRTTAIAPDPGVPNTLYIGAAGGGVWKTTDGGSSWIPLTDQQPSLAIGAIAVDPNNHNIIYAGTGEANNSQDSYYGAGILKSTDGGANWTVLGASVFGNPGTLGNTYFSKIVVNPPPNPPNIFAATSRGVYRSIDGGTNWTQVLNGAATDLVLDTNLTPLTVYAAIGSKDGTTAPGAVSNGIYKSTNGGAAGSFSPLTNGLPTMGASAGRIALDISSTSRQRLYTIITEPRISPFGTGQQGLSRGVWTTADGGTSWTNVVNFNGFCGFQCWYDLFLKIDPVNPQTVYIGGIDLFKTTDGGLNWIKLTSTQFLNAQTHADQHFLAFQPGVSSTLYLANDGGVWKSSDSGANWASLNNGLATLQFYGGAAGPNFGTTPLIYGGTQDNGLERYNGSSLDWPLVRQDDHIYTAIDFNNPNIAYTEQQFGDIQKTTDGGVTWVSATNGNNIAAPFIAPYVMDSSNSNRLVAGTNQNIFETTDGAANWHSISPDLGVSQALAIAPTNGNVIYAASNNNSLWVTTNASAPVSPTWNLRNTGLPNRFIKSIAIDPTNANRAVISFSGFAAGTGTGHVYLTNNAGVSWVNVSGNLPDVPINSILIDARDVNAFYVGTDAGFFFTTDAGANWSSLQNGLPKSPIYQLFTDPQFSTIIAATHGRGMFALADPCSFNVASPVVNSAADDVPVSTCSVTLRKALLQASANATITFNLSAGATINLTGTLPTVPSGVSIVANYSVDANGRGVPGVRIDGFGAGAGVNGFNLNSNSKLQGLAITRFSGYGISISGSNNSVYASYIGTADGINPLANGGGIQLSATATNNFIGGNSLSTSPRYFGNLISGNTDYGIYAGTTTNTNPNNLLKYNFIGYRPDGITPLPNTGGVSDIFSQRGLKFGVGNKVHR